MRRTTAVWISLGLLAGCSGGDDQAKKDALFLEMAKEKLPAAKDATLLEVRAQTCAAFKAAPVGPTYAKLISAATRPGGLTAAQAGAITALSVVSACPEYESLTR